MKELKPEKIIETIKNKKTGEQYMSDNEWKSKGVPAEDIQKVVLEKTGTRYARSATIINIIYAAVLFYFKELNDLPMSTTWVFVGLLCGRELAISTMNKDYKFKYVFPLIGKDFLKMI